MSDKQIIGRIEFERPAPRVVRVIKDTTPVPRDDDYQRRCEIAILRMYAAKYPEIVRQLVDKNI